MSTIRQLAKNTLQITAAGLGHHRWSSRQSRLWILMYHRILPASDPRFALEEPGMVVTPETFTEHLRILPEFFQPMSLSEWHQRAREGKPLPAKACAISFDDGWSDNYEYALPILKASGTPATLFAVADLVGTTRQFWPNRVSNLLINQLPGLHQSNEAAWLITGIAADADSLNREQVAGIIDRCKSISDSELDSRLDSIEDALGLPPAAATMVDWQQLREMSDSGLVEVGSHTCSHRRLVASLPAEIAQHEIVQSKAILERELEKPVELFCYPNGDYSPIALQWVRKTYRAAVTTRRGLNDASTAAHQLNRIGMHEDISNSRTAFLARLSGWM